MHRRLPEQRRALERRSRSAATVRSQVRNSDPRRPDQQTPPGTDCRASRVGRSRHSSCIRPARRSCRRLRPRGNAGCRGPVPSGGLPPRRQHYWKRGLPKRSGLGCGRLRVSRRPRRSAQSGSSKQRHVSGDVADHPDDVRFVLEELPSTIDQPLLPSAVSSRRGSQQIARCRNRLAIAISIPAVRTSRCAAWWQWPASSLRSSLTQSSYRRSWYTATPMKSFLTTAAERTSTLRLRQNAPHAVRNDTPQHSASIPRAGPMTLSTATVIAFLDQFSQVRRHRTRSHAPEREHDRGRAIGVVAVVKRHQRERAGDKIGRHFPTRSREARALVGREFGRRWL